MHTDLSRMELSVNFKDKVTKAIGLLSERDGSITNDEVIHLFLTNEIEYGEAVEILLFLPIAFVRQLLPNIKWPDTYTEVVEQHHIKRKFSETDSYLVIYEVTTDYWRNAHDSNSIVKIAGRSAEFHVINELILKDPNTKIEEIRLTENVIVRK